MTTTRRPVPGPDREVVALVLESTPGRPSILATGAGRGGGRSIMLNGHLDTVSLAAYDGDPLDSVVDDGRLHGRGSYDMKAGIAAMLVAAARAHHHPHDGDVVLARSPTPVSRPCSSASTAQAPTPPRSGSTSARSTTPPGPWNTRSPRGPAWPVPNNDTRDRSEH